MSKVTTKVKGLFTVHCSLFTDNKGIALVMVLVLSAITLAIMAGLIYMVTIGTQTSGMQKRYNTALEAGLGGTDITYLVIFTRGNETSIDSLISNLLPAATLSIIIPDTCTGTDRDGGTHTGIAAKILTSTATWSVDCNSSTTINTNTPATYDMTLTLGTPPLEYAAYAKIVDTVEGNTAGGEALGGGGVTEENPPQVLAVPALYTIEVNTQNTTNPAERAKLSILYQY